MATPVSVPLLDHFATLKDPRQSAKVLYPLLEILLLVLSATQMAGASPAVDLPFHADIGVMAQCGGGFLR